MPEQGAPEWEILPQAAGAGEVILSKRNELGILFNFAPTPFVYRGKRDASVEGFWQSLHYPESQDDPRAKFPGIHWPHTRAEVEAMRGFTAKAAGDAAYAIKKKIGIGWVTFEGKRMDYWTKEKGDHYRLIVEVMRAKLEQNPEVRKILLSTGELKLRPDHHQQVDAPPAWRYNEIWMQIRAELGR